MDFDFNDQQYMFQDSVRALFAQGAAMPDLLWRRLAEAGVFAILVPEEQGGLGLGFVDLALALEEFGQALAPPQAAETCAATDIIVRYGSAAQQARLLPAIAEGRLRIALAVQEAEQGYVPEAVAATAIPAGNGWALSGRKILVSDAASADYLLVTARVGASGEAGVLLVDRNRTGITLRQQTTLDLNAMSHEVVFADVDITADDMVGATPLAVARLADVCGAMAALQMNGISAKVLDIAVEHVRQRVQFDRPIGSFQAIKHRCADIAVAIDAARSAAYFAAWAVAEDAPERAFAVSIAKSYCSDTSRFACNEATQLHGGMGFTWELGLHHYLRRAKTLEYSYGDASYHRERLVVEALAQLDSQG